MSARPRLALVAVLVAAAALGAYAATRSGDAGGSRADLSSAPGGRDRAADDQAGPAAALDEALAASRPVYLLVRSET